MEPLKLNNPKGLFVQGVEISSSSRCHSRLGNVNLLSHGNYWSMMYKPPFTIAVSRTYVKQHVHPILI